VPRLQCNLAGTPLPTKVASTVTTTWIYRFDHLDDAERHAGGTWDDVRGLLGGKGANLADMSVWASPSRRASP
jgi:hypothetical protein